MHSIYPAGAFDTTISYPSSDYPVPSYSGTDPAAKVAGWAPFTSKALLHLPNWSNGSGRKGILACHGLGGTAWSAFHAGTDSNWSDYVRVLADAGYAVLAMDLGAKHFGNNLALTALDQAYSFLTGLTGTSTVGLVGSSAGGLAALNWLHKRPTQVAATFLINPFIDADVLRGAPAVWTVPYSVQPGDPNYSLFTSGGASNANASDINSAYLAATDADWLTNAVNQGRTPARYPGDFAGRRIHIAKAQMDGTIPYQQDVWWVGAVNSPTVTLKIYTGATLNHVPNTMLGGGTTDAATVAAGGLPRSALRDFFYEFL